VSLSYIDMLERTESEERRRDREVQIMQEGKALWEKKKKEEEDLLFRDLEELKGLQKSKMFGRPGHGAPTQDIRKKKFTEHQMNNLTRSQSLFGLDSEVPGLPDPAPISRYESQPQLEEGDVLNFGRSGAGAPVRGTDGQVRAVVMGNPEIRFQDNESVQRSIHNAIRYHADPQFKSQYHADLEQQIQQRDSRAKQIRDEDVNITNKLQEVEGTQWGKPGPGGAYWRPSAITGQGFFEKMGWHASSDPRRREIDIRRNEAESYKQEMSEAEKRRTDEHKNINSEIGIELAPLIMDKVTGKPKRDPSTGYMMNHSLSTTDVTQLAINKSPQPWHDVESKQLYWEQLTGQVAEKANIGQLGRKMDDQQQRQHFQSWESYWGRPGNGAPRDKSHKENLIKMLHFGDAVEKVPSNVELITLERLSVK